MTVTLTFFKLKERRPEHGQEIVYMNEVGSAFGSGLTPTQIDVEYSWMQLDEDGTDSGCQFVYNAMDPALENCRLMVLFDEYEAKDDTLWMPIEDWRRALYGENYVARAKETKDEFERYARLDEDDALRLDA